MSANKYFKLKYADGTEEIVVAPNALTLIRQRDLCTKAHINTRIIELAGEQFAIAQSTEE